MRLRHESGLIEYKIIIQIYDVVTAETATDDPVCRLSPSEKLRVCASVLNSSFFIDKVKFVPDIHNFKEECKLMRFSFQTDKAKAEANGGHYEEWMLPCSVEPIAVYAPSMLLVSRSYHSHYAFVYSFDYLSEEWYIENISGRISVLIEENGTIRKECSELTRPNFDDQLKSSRNSTDEEVLKESSGGSRIL